MWKVGVTGGIGSGKTMVCRVFETLGIPVFYADDAAKYLLHHDAGLQKELIALFGEEAYQEGRLQSAYISSIVFRDQEKLKAMNQLVHPLVIQYGRDWMASQTADYVVKEAALFFESGSHTEMDFMIGVTAPEALRIRRVVQRDQVTEEKVRLRMARQMEEREKMSLCDFIIVNDDVSPVLPQVLHIHEKLRKNKNAGH